ncbi:MAG TPA: hypothetical protein VKR30_12220 [Candidatus Limnocylindrales bacterium]|nr:hypothetical protein [Candidatus Limnocylindrales bacterium]
MSKRHQSSRRRSYGRRQHEVHERHDRRAERDGLELDWRAGYDDVQLDPLAFMDPRGPRPRFGFLD